MITQRETWEISEKNGFHQHPRDCGTAVALSLIASEAFEALSAHRKWDNEAVKEELADIILRTFDLAESLGFDVMAAAEAKHKVNLTRPFKHGDKRY